MGRMVFRVTEALGVKRTDDGAHMLVGFKVSSGDEIVLVLDSEGVNQALNCVIEATSISPLSKGAITRPQEAFAFVPDWFGIGAIMGTDDVSITFMRRVGHITFDLSRSMAEQMLEALAFSLGRISIVDQPRLRN
jgi:hypothetical protein